MGAFLALTSAVCYGIVDFTGGKLSRRVDFAAVSLLGRLGGLVLAVAAAWLVPAGAVRSADLLGGRCPASAAQRPCTSSTGA